MSVFEYDSTITYSDISENNEMSTRGILRILSEAAGVHSDIAGYGLNDVERTHYTWMILNWHLQIFNRPRWNSTLHIKTWSSGYNKLYTYRDFEVYDKDKNLVALASTKWVLIDSVLGKIAKITPELMSAYGTFETSVFEEKVDDREKEPEDSKLMCEYQIRHHDIDTNHHVNNLYYYDFAYDALPENLAEKDFDDITILYKKQIKLGAKIKCFYFYNNSSNEHIVTIKNEDLSIVHALIKLKE